MKLSELLYNEYKKLPSSKVAGKRVVNYEVFTKILNIYTRLLAKEILKGYKMTFNRMGSLVIVRVVNKSSRLQVLSGKTARLRKETGDPTAVVYRENPYFYMLQWELFTDHYKKFTFKGSKNFNRAIPDYKEVLDMKR